MMAASLTYRNNVTANNPIQHTTSLSSSSWKDVAIPRRKQCPPTGEDLSSSITDNNRKRPRADGEWEGGLVGEARGNYSSSPLQSKSVKSKLKSKGSKQERRASQSSVESSYGHKSARRSSLESVKSSTSSTSTSSSGGLRRLKKFSADNNKKPKKSPTTSTSSAISPKKKDGISVSESFQQTQLRLWQAAQEQAKKLKEEQEKKRLKAIKKKKLREKLQQERQQKLLGVAGGVKGSANPSGDDGAEQQPTKERRGSSLSSKEQSRKDRETTMDSADKNERGSRDQESAKLKKSTGDGEWDESERDREALKVKKLKKLKKLQRQQSATAADNIDNVEEPYSSQSLSSWEEEDAGMSNKKKRRLMKLARTGKGEGDDLPPRKKKKVFVDRRINDGDDDTKQTLPRNDERSNNAFASPTTPERKLTLASLDSAPLTPLSMGLADTVKTRVRSCTKAKDELELLQAASFERKKRKKNKQVKKALTDDFDDGYAAPTTQKKKKKKAKKKQPISMDYDSEYCSAAENLPKKKKKKKKQRWNADDYVYDADVEALPILSTKKQDRKQLKSSAAIDSMSDIASLETSSSTTVVTGKIKKKKRLKSVGSYELSFQDSLSSVDVVAGDRPIEQPLPFKKRMALAAAAAESFAWERNNAASTTASKISISSSGTGACVNEFGTEASSISEFTHPLGSTTLPLPAPAPSSTTLYHKPTSVPTEILSRPPTPPPSAPSFGFDVDTHAKVIGPTISSSDDSDSSSDSDTDEEELFSWANKMFGTSAKPVCEGEKKKQEPTPETTDLTPEMCEMERRRQRQEEARTLSVKEVNAILQEERNKPCAPAATHWVRRSVRQPSRSLLHAPLTRKLLDKLRGNDADMVVLKMKKYLPDPDTPSMVMDAVLEALEENTNCESLYIQNFNVGMKDKQVLHLLRILQQPSCNIWCLNIGETYNVSEDTWEVFAEGLQRTKVTHMYASEHTITAELKDEIRETIRFNRRKHNMHNDPNNLDTIIKCTHCWWNPINAKVLRPYLRKRGFESLLNDKEAQGLRGSMSEAPAE